MHNSVLKDCPMCGSVSQIIYGEKAVWARCDRCGLESSTYSKDNINDLINYWNTRWDGKHATS